MRHSRKARSRRHTSCTLRLRNEARVDAAATECRSCFWTGPYLDTPIDLWQNAA